jgi:hypothetical protein
MRRPYSTLCTGTIMLVLSAQSVLAAPSPERRRAKKVRPALAEADEDAAPTVSASPPFLWRQVFAAPSIGDRVRTFAIDPRDARRIFVGTEEGRLLRTTDAGVTWLEIAPQPFFVKKRSQTLTGPGRPDPGDLSEGNFGYSVTPPGQDDPTYLAPLMVFDPFPNRPGFFYAGLSAGSSFTREPLLGDVTRSRSEELVPIRSIAICPGARYDVFVATRLELLGSMDGGLSFVRLFANPGGLGLERVACALSRPTHVALTTEVGLFISRNGGLTFDQDLTAWPGQPASLAQFGPMGSDGRILLYSTSDDDLYAGDPDAPRGLEHLYPGSDPETAPWLPIRGLSVDDDEIWLATDDGVRRSRDGGRSFETVARTLFSRQSAEQVVVGRNERGGRRVAVMINHTPRSLDGAAVSGLHDSIVYSSDDGGQNWLPFFFGLSRRSFQIMSFVPAEGDRPASWWVATSGEIWTTAPFVTPVAATHRADVKWAQEALEGTPPLYGMIERALEVTRLGNAAVESLADRHRLMAWVPRLDMLLEWSEPSVVGSERSDSPVDPELSYAEQAQTLSRGTTFYVQARWNFQDFQSFDEEVESTRTQLYELRKQVAYAVEDAWHERVVHLELMARGLSDPLQVLSLKSRIESLDVLLAVWTGQERWEER